MVEPNARLGHYQVLSALGRGGMGEVWRARDTRLDRDVAIKTLPDEFARDADRLARFEREARLLASLNHPNIAAVYGLEESGGQRFLVLELVEGDTLADRVAVNALPVNRALDFAGQIAEAIEAAHEAGVIHRDLKPANIKVTPDGKVKVLDFGLAKAFASDGMDSNLTHSPTLSMAATLHGVILGTASYMSPEQARGTVVDRRADIWAFGCVLFEMLTGSRAFDGGTISDVMASVLKSDPDYASLPAAIDPRLRPLLERCFQKDPRKRWRDIGDLRLDLESLREVTKPPHSTSAAPPRLLRFERPIWASALVLAVVTSALVAVRFGNTRSSNPQGATGGLVRFSLSLPADTSLYTGGWNVPFAFSPDGRWVAFTATSADGRSRLWIRPMASETAQVVPGTEGATTPIWSPDSEWLAYQGLNVWYRVRIPGGAPETITSFRGYTNPMNAGAWGDGVLIFTGTNGALLRVSPQGGQPTPLTALDSAAKERGHFWPQFLSDGRRFLYVAGGERARVFVDSIDGGGRTLVMEMTAGASTIRYAAGHLFYVDNSVLWAQRFDESGRHLTGERHRVVSGLSVAGGSGASAFSVSQAGGLVYWTQTLIQQAAQLQWMDRKGNRLGPVGSPVVYDGFDLSQNEHRLASAQVGRNGIELWVHDLTAGGSSFPLRLNPRGTVPVWAPDGKQVVYLCDGSLCLAEADGTTENAVRLTEPTRNQLAQNWTSSGDRLLYEDFSQANGVDLVVLDMKTKRVDRLPWNTTANEFGARLSPDNRWLAYVTDQTGRHEVWIAAFPSGQPRRQISLAGGSHPSWRSDGSELYFISAKGQLVAMPFGGRDSTIEVGTPADLFRIPGTIDIVAGSHNIYQPGRDGQRFLVAVQAEFASVPPVSVILNWPQLLLE